MEKYLYAFLILFFVLTFNSCDSGVGITNPDNYVIGSNPKTIQINIDLQLLTPETSPIYSVPYSELEFTGCALQQLKYIYPGYNHDQRGINSNYAVQREFNVLPGDSFKVKINKCETNSEWIVDLGSISGENYKLLNTDIKLLRVEKTYNIDSTINYCFIFLSQKNSQGYISFIENRDQGSELNCNESHGLLIGYTINPLDKIIFNIDEIEWSFNTAGFSNVVVKIRGSTNVYRLRGMSYGDGITMAREITIQDDNSFETEYTVAFSYQEGMILPTNSELILYGTVGLPMVVTLINPENNS